MRMCVSATKVIRSLRTDVGRIPTEVFDLLSSGSGQS